MSCERIEETTTLTSKIFESSLEWNVVNFNEYSKHDIGSITSRKVRIIGTDIYWILHVHPHGYHSSSKYDYEDNHSSSSFDDDYVSLSLQIKCKNPSQNHCFKVEVKTDLPNDLDENAETTNKIAPVEWDVEVENVDRRTHLELYKEAFIKGHELHNYMFDGTLRLLAKVSMKYLDIWDHSQADDD